MGDYLIFVGLGAAGTALGMVLIIGRRLWANRHWSSRPKTATNERNVTVGEPVSMTADELLELAAHEEADIELSVSDVDAALRIIRGVLQREAAPPGTTITQYEPTVIVHDLHGATRTVRDA